MRCNLKEKDHTKNHKKAWSISSWREKVCFSPTYFPLTSILIHLVLVQNFILFPFQSFSLRDERKVIGWHILTTKKTDFGIKEFHLTSEYH